MTTRKAWMAALGLLATTLGMVLADQLVTGEEWGLIAQVITGAVLSIGTAYGVWRVPNDPE